MDEDFKKWVLSEGDPIEELAKDIREDIGYLPSDCTLPWDVDIIWEIEYAEKFC